MSATFRIGPAVVLVAPSISSPLADWTEVHRTQGGINVTLPSPEISRGRVNTAGAPVAAWMAPGMSMTTFKMVNRDLATMAAMLPTALQMTASAKKALKLDATLSAITPMAIAVVPVSEYNDDLMFLGAPSAVWYEKAVVKVGEMQATPTEDNDELDGYQVEIMSMSGYSGIGYPEIADTGLDIQGLGLFYQPVYDTLDPIQGPAATFTRASTATYVDDDGVIQTATSGTLRIQSGRALLEPQRTNYSTHSVETGTAWSLSTWTRTANYGVAPDGASTSCRIQAVSGGGYVGKSTTSAGAGVAEALSFYIKPVTASGSVRVVNWQGVSYGNWTVDFSQLAAGEWQRIDQNHPAVTVSDTWVSTAGSISGWQIDGASTSLDFELWGVSIEAGSYATSYIPTAGSTATRNADAFQITWPTRPSVQEDWTAMVKMVYKGRTGANTQINLISSTGDGITLLSSATPDYALSANGFTLDSAEVLNAGSYALDEEVGYNVASDADGNLSLIVTEAGTNAAADTFAWSAVKNSTDEFGDTVVAKYAAYDAIEVEAIIFVRGLLTPSQMRRILR